MCVCEIVIHFDAFTDVHLLGFSLAFPQVPAEYGALLRTLGPAAAAQVRHCVRRGRSNLRDTGAAPSPRGMQMMCSLPRTHLHGEADSVRPI